MCKGETMRAFHGDPAIKAKYLARVVAHRDADRIVQKVGWQYINGEWKGCAVGCTLENYAHWAYETELGIPEILARVEDSIHEGLPLAEALDWPRQFLDVIPVGADLSDIWPQFALWLMSDPTYGVLQLADDRTRPVIERVIELYERRETSREEWQSVANEVPVAYTNDQLSAKEVASAACNAFHAFHAVQGSAVAHVEAGTRAVSGVGGFCREARDVLCSMLRSAS